MSVNVASCGYHVVVDCVVQLVSEIELLIRTPKTKLP